MADDIAQWLESLGLGQYAQAFSDNAIDIDVLPDLTEADLDRLGVLLGHQKRLLRAIGTLDEGATSRPDAAPVASFAPQQSVEAERRQITVLFADLVGSTALSARLDPEDMRELLRAYQDACAGIIARYDGYIAKFMGDGVYAYFGYPQAHEDDAERAIYAGLELADAVHRLSGPGKLVEPLAVRVGIATGTVVIGDLLGEGASEEAAITGEAPNLAARLQEIASPGAVLTASATYHLAGRRFECRSLGQQSFRGFDEPVPVWEVVRARPTETRFEAVHGAQLSTLIGRQEELEIVVRRWERAKGGDGQVVVISGEPGIGKSRLVRALADEIDRERQVTVRLQCSPFHANSALHPFIESLARAIGFMPDDDAASKFDKLEAWLALADQDPTMVGPLFASLFGIDGSARWPALEISAQQQKKLTLCAIVDRQTTLATRDPFALMVEDAHWVDPTTLELLDMMVENALANRLLIVITCRPEFAPPWTGRAHVTLLPLNRLNPRDCAALADGVSGGKALPDELRDQIVAKTDGVPLFVEELTKSVLEAGVLSEKNGKLVVKGDIGDLAVPATIQDSLEARLDRLGPVKEIAQIGAVIGREFRYDLLAKVAPLAAAELDRALFRLVQSELVFCRGQPPDATYTFKHALVQDTAYASLLRGRRRELHGRVVDVLERHFPQTAAAEPDVLAHHCGEAGWVDKAVRYTMKAADAGLERANYAEANAQLESGLDILSMLPDVHERAALELELQIARSSVIRPMYNPGHESHEATVVRSLELCDEVGDRDQLSQVLFALCLTHFWRVNIREALKEARRLMEIAEATQDRNQLLRADSVLGRALWLNGRNTEARACFDRLEATYDPQIDLPQTDGASVFISQAYSALSWFVLGYPDRAAARAETTLEMGSASLHLMAVFAAVCAARICAWRGEPERVLSLSEPFLARWEKAGEKTPLTALDVMRSWALARLGRAPDGAALVDDVMAQWNAIGKAAYFLLDVLPAEVQIASGRSDDALQTADEILARIDETEERQFESLALMTKGDALSALIPTDPGAAERCYHAAIKTARAQSAKSWELRAVTRLARLWHGQGRTAEARDLLAPIYGWFTEGFDTADLKAARALLDQLG